MARTSWEMLQQVRLKRLVGQRQRSPGQCGWLLLSTWGIERMPEAFLRLLYGKNFGKQIVRIS